jgi:hypothetical protein
MVLGKARARWRRAARILALGLLVVSLPLYTELRGVTNRHAIRAIRDQLKLAMPQDEARVLIEKGLERSRVTVASPVVEPGRDYVRINTGFVASWILEVRYSNGRVVAIHAGTENGPWAPAGFPSNQP